MVAFILYIILILFGIFIPKSKIVFYMQWCYFSVAMCLNKGGPDIETYQAMYYMFSDAISDIFIPESLYRNIVYFSSNVLGLGFDQFKVGISIIGMILLGVVIMANSKFPAIIMSFIMIYPGVDLIIQTRNFIGMVFLLIGISFLFGENKLRFIIYGVCILLASGFHYLFLIYFILPFILVSDKRFLIKVGVGYIFILPVFIYFLPSVLSYIIPVSKFDAYFNKTGEGFHIISALFLMFFQLAFVVILMSKKFSKLDMVNDFTFKICCFSIIAIPFCFFDSTFFRIYRNLLPFLYILMFYDGKPLVDRRFMINKYYVFFLFFFVINSVLLYSSGHGWEYTVKPLFIENDFFKIINI